MNVLYPKFPGLIICCSNCGALLQYTLEDIYGNSIWCPKCKQSTEVPIQKYYSGVIINDALEKQKEESSSNFTSN